MRIKLMWGNNVRAPVVSTRSNEATLAHRHAYTHIHAQGHIHTHVWKAEQIAKIPCSFCGAKKKPESAINIFRNKFSFTNYDFMTFWWPCHRTHTYTIPAYTHTHLCGVIYFRSREGVVRPRSIRRKNALRIYGNSALGCCRYCFMYRYKGPPFSPITKFALKKIGTKNKANKSDKKANAWSGAKKSYYTKARKKFCSSWMQLACVCACVECIWLCMGCSSCCHFPAFVLNFLDDFRAAYFWAHNLWPPGIKLAKAQHEKATSGAY